MIKAAWTGWDGSEWDLRSGQVRLTNGGFEGLSMAPVENFTRETALTDGQRYTGWRAQPRKVLMPVLIGQAQSELAWLQLERAWWKTMRPGKEGTLSITAPDGATRTLGLRFEDDGGLPMGKDPSMDRLTLVPFVMTADNPWWSGPQVDRELRGGDAPVNWLGGASGKAAPFVIGRASLLGRVTLDNPGDMPAYPIYRVRGPVDSWKVEIGASAVSSETPLLAGETLVVETSPSRQVAYLYADGVQTNVTRQLVDVNFAAIPAEDSARLDVTLVGNGSMTVEYVPRYFRAW